MLKSMIPKIEGGWGRGVPRYKKVNCLRATEAAGLDLFRGLIAC